MYLSAIRAGMVSVVTLTIIGGVFIIVSFLPINGWDKIIAPYLQLLRIEEDLGSKARYPGRTALARGGTP